MVVLNYTPLGKTEVARSEAESWGSLFVVLDKIYYQKSALFESLQISKDGLVLCQCAVSVIRNSHQSLTPVFTQ